RVVREEFGIVGKIVAAVVGVAWGIATAFAVPVIVMEDRSAVESIRRSMKILRERWGESLVGTGAITLPLLAVALGVAMTSGIFFVISPILGGVVLGAGLAAVMVIGSALTGIFRAAVYAYATDQGTLDGFDPDDLTSAYRTRKRRRLAG
ncbi:MAG TPA: DUF6159 family protein, partial [Candidatus Dormibacteraeota bacterium]